MYQMTVTFDQFRQVFDVMVNALCAPRVYGNADHAMVRQELYARLKASTAAEHVLSAFLRELPSHYPELQDKAG